MWKGEFPTAQVYVLHLRYNGTRELTVITFIVYRKQGV